MIHCVTIATTCNFPLNLVTGQHRLRHREVVQKERWTNVYTLDGMEFDAYDNLATEYYVACDPGGEAVGVTRSYPTTIPFMLSEPFRRLIRQELPSDPRILEASRLVLDRSRLPKEARRPVIDQLLVAYMERGLQRNIDAYVGFMLPKIWDSTFLRIGWDVKWLGPEMVLDTGETVRAALMPVNPALDRRIREATGLRQPVLDFGDRGDVPVPGAAHYSQETEPFRRAA